MSLDAPLDRLRSSDRANSSVDHGRAIQRRTGRTFHLATLVLPARVRHPTYVLYGFFRRADEIVDDVTESTKSPAAQRAELESLREMALGRTDPDGPLMAGFQTIRREHDLRDEDVHEFIDAMCADTHVDEYETFDDLEAYMRGSAAAVGSMMLSLMDPEAHESVRQQANALGKAFQMTNFIRDVREDVVELGRVYLPQTTLAEHGVTESHLRSLSSSESVRNVVKAELRRTEALYREGVAGIGRLPRDCQFAVLLAAVLYAEHHRLIRAREFDVLTDPPSLSLWRKLDALVRTWWTWQRCSDPVATFEAVSAIPACGTESVAPLSGREQPCWAGPARTIARSTAPIRSVLGAIRARLLGGTK
jgi:phytoene synthase